MTQLETWMTANGVRDAELAEAVGISRSQICRIRQGKVAPSLAVAARIEAFTGVPAALLLPTAEAA